MPPKEAIVAFVCTDIVEIGEWMSVKMVQVELGRMGEWSFFSVMKGMTSFGGKTAGIVPHSGFGQIENVK